MSATIPSMQTKPIFDTNTDRSEYWNKTNTTIGNDYEGLTPWTIDELFRMLKAFNPSIDILELPVVKDALKEKLKAKFQPSTPTIHPQLSYHARDHDHAFIPSEPASKVTIRIMVSPKDSPIPTASTHELMEIDTNLSYLQLDDVLRRFLLKHYKDNIKARQNPNRCVFTPDHSFHKIKAIWYNFSGGVGGEWTGTGAVLPSNDVVLTENNCEIILRTMLKRTGALDTLDLATFVPEE